MTANIYLVGENRTHIVALIPLENNYQFKDEINNLIHQEIIKNIIISETVQGVVDKLNVNWKKCRIYDSNNLPLIERKSTHYQGVHSDIQFIIGSIGKKIKPYIEIQSITINDKQAFVTGVDFQIILT